MAKAEAYGLRVEFGDNVEVYDSVTGKLVVAVAAESVTSLRSQARFAAVEGPGRNFHSDERIVSVVVETLGHLPEMEDYL